MVEYVIQDASIKYASARNAIEESLLYVDQGVWTRNLDKAKKFPDSESAAVVARELHKELPVKILLLQRDGNKIGVGNVTF